MSGTSPWLATLPALAAELATEWELSPSGPAIHGRHSLVLPVLTADGVDAALKIGRPREEAGHEHLALQHWHGQGAVRLLRADPHRRALLLERAGPRDLTSVADVVACQTVAGLLARLHRPAPPQLARLSVSARGWAEQLTSLPRSAPVPRRLVEHAAALARDLARDPATDGTLIHTDARGANVLAAEREPWLVIAPKPMSGDPHYEPAPLLWTRWREVTDAGPRRVLRRRLDAVVDALGLDPDRARDWVVVREACHALRTVQDAERRGGGLSAADHEGLTRVVTITKAILD